MSKAPSMPMFWDAYLADTTHLTTEEHGAYLLLLAAMWRRNGWVPDDDKDLARILGMTPAKWRKIKDRLAVFLTFAEGQITQKNLLKIWKITQEKIESNRANGAKGGRPKSRENKGIGKANGSVSLNPNETIPEPEPVKKEEAKASSKKRGSRLPENWQLPKPWGEWAVSEGLDEISVRRESDRFRDYWISAPSGRAIKLDWHAVWRNWVRKVLDDRRAKPSRHAARGATDFGAFGQIPERC